LFLSYSFFFFFFYCSVLLCYLHSFPTRRSSDLLFILLIIFSQSQTKKGIRQIYLGQYLGTGILVAVSLFAAYVLNFIPQDWIIGDRKSTRLNSSHVSISYAVFCLKKKIKTPHGI